MRQRSGNGPGGVMSSGASWICCQLGAREHYAVPRALHRRGKLAQLVTDAWAPPGPLSGLGRLGQRYHADLAAAPVDALTPSLVGHELVWRLQGQRGWEYFTARNAWFQSAAAAALHDAANGGPTIVFAHSYAAAGVLREGRRRGWTTVLGQIDPGPEHFAIQERLAISRPEYQSSATTPPAEYFDNWRDECSLADVIVVNSPWSRQLLARAGIPEEKIRVVPLPYEPPAAAAGFARTYPAEFSARRPLRALFVGSATVTKGVPELLESIALLQGVPIELRLVGERAIVIPDRFASHRQVEWIGAVDRDAVMEFYRSSDVLVFPTHSDGFGMAQVEAQAWGLPIVASRHCGEVVRDGETGVLIDEVSAGALAAALGRLVESPSLLSGFSDRARAQPAVTLATLADGLLAIEPA